MTDRLPLTYSHRPKPFAPELDLRLTASALEAERGKSRQVFPLGSIGEIRLTFTPRNLARRAFTCKVTASDGRSVSFDNLSWRSLVALDRHDDDYRAFVAALARAARAANPRVALIGGLPNWKYAILRILGIKLAVLLVLACAYFVLLPNLPYAGLAAVTLLYLGLWLDDFLKRNRPAPFEAEAPPARLLPGPPA